MTVNGTDPRGFHGETRAALVEAAFELIEREGFAAATAADIAEKAGFTERTFFRYFSAKDDVIFAPLESRFEDYLPYIHRHISADGLTVDTVIRALLEADDENPSRRALVVRGVKLAENNPELERRLAYHRHWFADQVAEAVAVTLGQDRPALSVRAIVSVAVAIMGTAVRLWIEDDQQTPIREVIADVRRTAEDGLSGRDVSRRS